MKEKFCASGGDLCYYPLLFKALESSEGEVLEFGMGHGSTPLLNEYCTKKKRTLKSFDYNQEWRSKFDNSLNDFHSSELVTDWKDVYRNNKDASVIFIDQSPGEERKFTIVNYKDTAGILVIHDTEPVGAGAYFVRPEFKYFKYKVEVQTEGAWATALSNEIDITKWVGEQFGAYTIVL
jgi:hypothetical protein